MIPQPVAKLPDRDSARDASTEGGSASNTHLHTEEPRDWAQIAAL
jgi:hypothetical protein